MSVFRRGRMNGACPPFTFIVSEHARARAYTHLPTTASNARAYREEHAKATFPGYFRKTSVRRIRIAVSRGREGGGEGNCSITRSGFFPLPSPPRYLIYRASSIGNIYIGNCVPADFGARGGTRCTRIRLRRAALVLAVFLGRRKYFFLINCFINRRLSQIDRSGCRDMWLVGNPILPAMLAIPLSLSFSLIVISRARESRQEMNATM